MRPTRSFAGFHGNWMWRWMGVTLVVQIVSLLTAAPTPARSAERQLTDADIARWLPRLRAEAEAFTQAVRAAREASAAIESRSEEQSRDDADLASGKKDVLEWIRAHASAVPIPAGAVYSAECSRAVTAEGAVPTAVFTFGKESPYRDLLRRAATGDEAARDEFYRRRGEEETGERSAAAKATRDFTTAIAAFYRNRGFVDSEGPMVSILITILLSPDRSLTVWVSEANSYCGLLPRDLPSACSGLPTGPLLEIRLTGEAARDTASVGAGGEVARSSTATGATDPEYEAVKEALFLAQSDASNPETLEFEIPSEAPAEVKQEMAAIAASFATRRANVLVYKRHESTVAPLLAAFLVTPEQ